MDFISGLKLKDAPISEAQKREDLSSASANLLQLQRGNEWKTAQYRPKPDINCWGKLLGISYLNTNLENGY